MTATSEEDVLKQGRIDDYMFYTIRELLENDKIHNFVSNLLVNNMDSILLISHLNNILDNITGFKINKNICGGLNKEFCDNLLNYIENISVSYQPYVTNLNQSSDNILNFKEDLLIIETSSNTADRTGNYLEFENKYPTIRDKGIEFSKNKDITELFGTYYYVNTMDNKTIAVCFTRKNYVTDYELVFKCLKNIFKYARDNKCSIAISLDFESNVKLQPFLKELLINLNLIYDVRLSIYN